MPQEQPVNRFHHRFLTKNEELCVGTTRHFRVCRSVRASATTQRSFTSSQHVGSSFVILLKAAQRIDVVSYQPPNRNSRPTPWGAYEKCASALSSIDPRERASPAPQYQTKMPPMSQKDHRYVTLRAWYAALGLRPNRHPVKMIHFVSSIHDPQHDHPLLQYLDIPVSWR